MVYEAIVFDLFHTLVDTQHVLPHGYDPISAIADAMGADTDAFKAFWSDTSIERETTPIDVVDLVDRFAQANGGFLTSEQCSAVDGLLGQYRDVAILAPRPETVRLLEELSRSVRLGLLSDCYQREVRAWSVSPLAPFFTSVVFSFEVGTLKPSPDGYASVLNALEVQPDRAVYVGNGASNELKGARRAGFSLVVHCNIFDRENGLATDDEQRQRRAQADVSANTIEELHSTLEKCVSP
jgi:putative hydrolase of the HAD superfamily